MNLIEDAQAKLNGTKLSVANAERQLNEARLEMTKAECALGVARTLQAEIDVKGAILVQFCDQNQSQRHDFEVKSWTEAKGGMYVRTAVGFRNRCYCDINRIGYSGRMHPCFCTAEPIFEDVWKPGPPILTMKATCRKCRYTCEVKPGC